MLIFPIPRPLTIFAMNKLSEVDYNVATRVSETVAETVKWSLVSKIKLRMVYINHLLK